MWNIYLDGASGIRYVEIQMDDDGRAEEISDKEKRGFHDMLCDTRVVYEKKVKMYSEYQSAAGPQMSVQPREPVQSQPQAPVQPQASEPLQAETFSGAVQQKTQEYMPVREQNYVQKNVQVQSQSQPGQPYRAVPDGGYSFVSDAGQVKKEFTQAESEKATGTTGENVTEIKGNKEEVEDSIEENIQEGDL